MHRGPKKNALAGGIAASDGELVLFTDADCLVPPRWVASLVAPFEDEEVGLVAGYADRKTRRWIDRVLTSIFKKFPTSTSVPLPN